MHEILKALPAGSLALDLGCAAGSFPETATRATVIRADREPPQERRADARFVQADAARLPFADGVFAAVIANHSLEHFGDLARSLSEIGRVTRRGGALFAAVPDASTFTDRLYRWLARGGGHVNAFTRADEVAEVIARATALPHVATRVLCSSLSFLNRRNAPRPLPLRLAFLGAGHESTLFLYAWVSRRLDRWLGARASVYGWAFYFGAIAGPVGADTWVNVCIRCGSGCSAARLKKEGLVRRAFPGWRVFRCPECGATNPFAEDFTIRRELPPGAPKPRPNGSDRN